MNLQTILNSPNATLMLGGLAVLLLSVIVSALRLWRGYVRSGFFNVILVLGACALIGVGLVRMTFPALAGAATPPARAAANGEFSGGTAGQSGVQNGAQNGVQSGASTAQGAAATGSNDQAVQNTQGGQTG